MVWILGAGDGIFLFSLPGNLLLRQHVWANNWDSHQAATKDQQGKYAGQ